MTVCMVSFMKDLSLNNFNEVNAFKKTRKLSFRLTSIKSLIPKNSKVVWDLCCDHGLLGRKILEEQRDTEKTKFVHFVDCVPSIMQKLDQTLSKYFNASFYKTHTLDAANIDISGAEDECIIIAGVGGYKAIDILEGIISNRLIKSSFIISVHKDFKKVQDYLSKQSFRELKQLVIEDKKKEYKIILVEKK